MFIFLYCANIQKKSDSSKYLNFFLEQYFDSIITIIGVACRETSFYSHVGNTLFPRWEQVVSLQETLVFHAAVFDIR